VKRGRGKEAVKGKREGEGGKEEREEREREREGEEGPRKNLWPPLPASSGTLEPPLRPISEVAFPIVTKLCHVFDGDSDL